MMEAKGGRSPDDTSFLFHLSDINQDDHTPCHLIKMWAYIVFWTKSIILHQK